MSYWLDNMVIYRWIINPQVKFLHSNLFKWIFSMYSWIINTTWNVTNWHYWYCYWLFNDVFLSTCIDYRQWHHKLLCYQCQRSNHIGRLSYPYVVKLVLTTTYFMSYIQLFQRKIHPFSANDADSSKIHIFSPQNSAKWRNMTHIESELS